MIAPLTETRRDSDLEATVSIGCVDLFCGLGGLTHGLIRGGIRVRAGVDVDPDCRFAYEKNNGATFFERSVRDLTSAELSELFGDSERRLLAGCAPCQPFSTYSRKARKTKSDPKWDLASDFGRLASETKPDFVTMENVPQFGEHPIFEDLAQSLDGYFLWYGVVECAQYGVPQTRKRFVLLGSRLGPIELIPPGGGSTSITVESAIGHLRRISAGEADSVDRLHISSRLSELNLRRIKASRPGGTWRDWEPSLLASCHRKASGESYPSVYGRMRWDAPAPTITTQFFGYGNGRFGHPEQDRAISLREAAILQTFPETYEFLAPGERPIFSKFGRLIGNAVPVRLGEVVAESFRKHLMELENPHALGENSSALETRSGSG